MIGRSQNFCDNVISIISCEFHGEMLVFSCSPFWFFPQKLCPEEMLVHIGFLVAVGDLKEVPHQEHLWWLLVSVRLSGESPYYACLVPSP